MRILRAALTWLPAATAASMAGAIFVLQLLALGLPLPSFPSPATDVQIQNYVLFTNVPYGDWSIFTGTAYVLTRDSTISNQWCYAAPTASGADYTAIHIAAIGADGQMTVLSPSADALAMLRIGQADLPHLVQSHCRFQ